VRKPLDRAGAPAPGSRAGKPMLGLLGRWSR
jgi:hypothetical protein